MVSTPPRGWQVAGYLDALRPEPDWTVDLAILSAYSADPVSIVAVLLALIGRDDEERTPSRRDLADAVEQLRDRTRIVLQQGRLATMRQPPRLTGVLDQFVREVAFDERRHSWHAKAALVRMTRGAEFEWRLWVGSRNLTMPENLDLGLLLVGGRGGRGRVVPGAQDIARALAERAGLDGVTAKYLSAELDGVKWQAPSGTKVDRLRISRGDTEWGLPDLPRTADAVTVISPFLDKGFLRHVAGTSCAPERAKLLSTRSEVERLAATTRAFGDLYVLEAPDYPSVSGEAPAEAGAVETSGWETGRGLHAKLLHVRTGARRRIWMGSANATRRAWSGRNVEIIAELTVDEAVEEGLLNLIAGARPLVLGEDQTLTDAEPAEDRLERARAEVSAKWRGELLWDGRGMHLRHPEPPHPADPLISLEVGLITQELRPWPRAEEDLDLGEVEAADRTELVQLKLGLDGATCEWIVRAPATPPFGEERDRAAFMRAMGVREFLLWVADSLRGAAAPPDEPDWTSDRTRPADFGAGAGLSWTEDLPTQEEILAAWTRDKALFETVRKRVRTFLPALLLQTRETDPEGHAQLMRFEALWTTLEAGLGVRS